MFEVYASATILEPMDGNVTKMSEISHKFPGGSPPKKILKIFGKNEALFIMKLSNAIKECMPNPPMNIIQEGYSDNGYLNEDKIVKDFLFWQCSKDPWKDAKRGILQENGIDFFSKRERLSQRVEDADVKKSHETTQEVVDNAQIKNKSGSESLELLVIFTATCSTWFVVPSENSSVIFFFSTLCYIVLTSSAFCGKKRVRQILPYIASTSIVAICVRFCCCFWFALLPFLHEASFVIFLALGLRAGITNMIGIPAIYDDGTKVGFDGHSGTGTGAVNARFDVDLSGALQYIKENTVPSSEPKVSVTHLVVKAVALALSRMPSLNGRRVLLPLIGIKGFYQNDGIDIHVVPGVGSSKFWSNTTLKLERADRMSVNDVAKSELAFASRIKKEFKSKRAHNNFVNSFMRTIRYFLKKIDTRIFGEFGSAIILTSPNSKNSDVKIDVAPIANYNAATLVVTVGSIRLLKVDSKARPVLDILMTINFPAVNVPILVNLLN